MILFSWAKRQTHAVCSATTGPRVDSSFKINPYRQNAADRSDMTCDADTGRLSWVSGHESEQELIVSQIKWFRYEVYCPSTSPQTKTLAKWQEETSLEGLPF